MTEFGKPTSGPVTGADRVAARLPRRDSVVIVAALAAVTMPLSWLYVYLQMQPTADMADIAPAGFAPWSACDFALNLGFWWAMMPGMMLPSAAPMILTFATVNRRRRERGRSFVPTAVFAAGYLVAWGLFGVAATFADWGLERAALLSPATGALGPVMAAFAIAAAGLYQLTPLKAACLRALPLAARLRAQPLARRRRGRAADGARPRVLLPWLLLVSDGADVCRRDHEPVVDGGDRGVHPRRKAVPGRPADRPRRRRVTGMLGLALYLLTQG